MRKRRNKRYGVGKLFIIVGTTILLAMILPVKFWWFILGISLISFGIWYNQCYKQGDVMKICVIKLPEVLGRILEKFIK